MRAVLKLELIGDNYRWAARHADLRRVHLKQYINVLRYGQRRHKPWVAHLSISDGEIKRDFVESALDYSEANSHGSRGIYEYYALSDGIYEVNEATGLGRSRRYFIRVSDMTITEIGQDQDEAIQCLNNTSA